MTLDRNDKTGDLWARETGLGRDLNLTDMARQIKQRALPTGEIEAEVLSNVNSKVVTPDVKVILQKTLQELRKLVKKNAKALGRARKDEPLINAIFKARRDSGKPIKPEEL